jgi:glutaredoxin
MKKLTLVKRSTPVCNGCNIMKTMLDGEGIEHDVIDIAEQPAVIEQLGLTGVPVLLVDGEVKFTGITPIESILEAIK